MRLALGWVHCLCEGYGGFTFGNKLDSPGFDVWISFPLDHILSGL